MSRKHKQMACLILIPLTLAFIWGNSLLPGNVSGQISRGLMAWMKSVLSFVGITHHILRKMGHFSEFAAFGFLCAELFLLWGETGFHRLTTPVLAGLTAACVDETIQIFVDGRGSSLLDVWIDTAGVITGICILYALHCLITFKEKRI